MEKKNTIHRAKKISLVSLNIEVKRGATNHLRAAWTDLHIWSHNGNSKPNINQRTLRKSRQLGSALRGAEEVLVWVGIYVLLKKKKKEGLFQGENLHGSDSSSGIPPHNSTTTIKVLSNGGAG
jgi:hypothetical protein